MGYDASRAGNLKWIVLRCKLIMSNAETTVLGNVYKVASGAHCVPEGKPVQAKVISSLSPLVDVELTVAVVLPLGPTVIVVGLMLKEKSPIPSCMSVAAVRTPSVALTVTV